MTNFIANLLLPMLLTEGPPAVQGSASLEARGTEVEISVGGDDHWSRRLRRAVRQRFRAMADFSVVEEATSPDALTILILHHFHQPQGDGTWRVTYSLRIGRGTRVAALPAGTCSLDRLGECARQIGHAVHSARNWPNPAE
jgi:hypothetical protein